MRSFALEGNPMVHIEPTALHTLTALAVRPSELTDDRTNATLINGVGIPIPAVDLRYPGFFGGRASSINTVYHISAAADAMYQLGGAVRPQPHVQQVLGRLRPTPGHGRLLFARHLPHV